jgi:hypothetical protein
MGILTRKLLAVTAFALLTLVPVFALSAKTNEPADAQEQSEMTASVGDSPVVPYNPDPRLSDKAASMQPLFDYWNAATSAPRRGWS